MLEAGTTQGCEFQYVHHQPDGTPYAGGAWGIGFDSHICVNAAEEVMLLE